MKKIALCSLFLAAGMSVFAQKKSAKTAKPAVAAKVPAGFKKMPSGLLYKIVKHGAGTEHPALGDNVQMQMHLHVKDSVLINTRKAGKALSFALQGPGFKGDPAEIFPLMVAGDSAVALLPVDSLKAQGKNLPPFMMPGDMLEYDVVLVSVMSKEKQNAKDDAEMVAYFKKNNIKAMKTASGLYYSIESDGTGEKPKQGQNVTVNYTGRLLDGKAFDSNTDPDFKHVQPFTVTMGTGRVIRGWEEGLSLLKKGTKAVLYIPSGLAYGADASKPNIPPNSVLIFNIEVLDVADKVDQNLMDEKLIKDYLSKNNIKANKTASGLYYTIANEGSGDKPAKGQKLTVNYTGKLLDGTSFDSNMDPKFNHVSPFSLSIGTGQVIRGWDEGLMMFKKGGKGTLYIPSGLAYGPKSPTQAIPPNSVLVFDVEITDLQAQ